MTWRAPTTMSSRTVYPSAMTRSPARTSVPTLQTGSAR